MPNNLQRVYPSAVVDTVLTMKNRNKKGMCFALCITNAEPDLELRKVYQVLPDESAAKSHYLRIVDESGEDYLYPAHYFVLVEVPETEARALLASS
jgi:hypothetical protein